MALRVCAEPGCPELQRETRCAEHRSAKERARGTRQQRGYDAAHDRLRADWQRKLDAGELVICWRCKAAGRPHPIDPRSWDLGHENGQHRGPECPAGNRAEPRLRGGG